VNTEGSEMREITGSLESTDLGEFEGKIYGDITIRTGEGIQVLKYPLGAKIDLPDRGSFVSVRYSDDSNKIIDIAVIEQKNTDEETEIAPPRVEERPSFRISRNPLNWMFALVIGFLGVQMGYLASLLTHWSYYPESINSVRDTYILITTGLCILSIASSISLVIALRPLANLTSLIFAFGCSTIISFVWGALSTSPLLVSEEKQVAMLYATIADALLVGLICWIVFFAFSNLRKGK
jgi:hypothetical protein